MALLGHGRVVSGSHRTEGKTKEILYSFIYEALVFMLKSLSFSVNYRRSPLAEI